MHCVGRLLRLPYTDPDLWHVELSNRSFHALCWPIASISIYRPRPLSCRVINLVVSCTVLADCFDYRIQTAIYTSLLQFPCRRTEFGTKSFHPSLSKTERCLVIVVDRMCLPFRIPYLDSNRWSSCPFCLPSFH